MQNQLLRFFNRHPHQYILRVPPPPPPRYTVRSQAVVIPRKRTAICRESFQGNLPPIGSQTIYLVDGLHNSLTYTYDFCSCHGVRELHKPTHSPRDVTVQTQSQDIKQPCYNHRVQTRSHDISLVITTVSRHDHMI